MRSIYLGISLLLAGIVLFGLTLTRLMGGTSLDPQTKTPGTLEIEVQSPGNYYLWDNHWTSFEGEQIKYAADFPEDSHIAVHDANGKSLEFHRDTSQAWSIGNGGKTSVGYVTVPESGRLLMEVDHGGHERVLSVSDRTMKEELWAKLNGFAYGLLLGVVGLTVAATGAMRHRRPKDQADQIEFNTELGQP